MRFYCYSEFDDSAIAARLGDADYSYYFVLKAYIPLLEQRGSVHEINRLDDSFMRDCQQAMASGTECLLLAFAPPHKIPLDLPCPVIPVFAWEYSSIPNRQFIDNPRDSWVDSLKHFGQALTHSSYAKRVVLHDVGDDFAIESIPAPLWDRCAQHRERARDRGPVKNVRLALSTATVDSAEFDITSESIAPASRISRSLRGSAGKEGPCRNVDVEFGVPHADIMMIGFYPPEGWGAWSKSSSPWIMLPSEVSGKIKLRLSANAYRGNIGRDIRMQIGDQSISLNLGQEVREFEFELDIQQPSNFLCFSNIDISANRTPDDPRTIGIGLARLSIESQDETVGQPGAGASTSAGDQHLGLNGVVYTSILNPQDGRKNWEDILTAFCLAFRDREDANLILKMTYKDMAGYIDDIFALFCQLHPFKCRIIVIHGYLSRPEYESLIEATSFVVNASRSEGQCLPLMEYMSSGIPAIAPDNTAMADYISTDNALIVDSSPEPHYWPHDPQQIFTTLWYRPSWESLHKCYLDSYALAKSSPERYAAMSEASWRSLRDFCSVDVLLARLDSFLNRISSK